MVFVRRSKFRKYRKAYRKRKAAKSRGQMKSNFVETLDAGYMNCNTGNIAGVQFVSVPQHQHYADLYRQYCITKLEIILVPEYNVAEVNAAAYNNSITAGGTTFPAPTYSGVARIAYAPLFSADAGIPSNEITVLTNNSAKIRQLTQNRPIRMVCRPVAALAQRDDIYGTQIPVSKRGQWLSTGTNGANVVHKGIQYWVTQQVNGAYAVQFTVAHVYYKVHFKLRDPK